MECLTSQNTLDIAFNHVRDASYSEKKLSIPTEEEVNQFLDKILELQQLLNGKSEKINKINGLLEKVTWLNGLDEDSLKQLNVLIAMAKDFHSTLIRHYAQLNFLRKKGIAKKAIQDFKMSIDNLKDAVADLDSVFFSLPSMPDFDNITKELSLM